MKLSEIFLNGNFLAILGAAITIILCGWGSAQGVGRAGRARRPNLICGGNIVGLILKPFAWLLLTFYNFFNSYGLALVLFAIVIKLILFPVSLKRCV